MSKNIAIIGAGISGLSTAFTLYKNNINFTIYEKNDYIGGNARTIDISSQTLDKTQVDTGFIVFNNLNYPNLTALFKLLNVDTIKTTMSLGVSINKNLEYSGTSISSLFAQRKNIFNPKFLKMLYDIIKFNNYCIKKSHLIADNMSLNDLIDKLKISYYCKYYYILPMGGAIWSTSISDMLNFPAKTFVNFCNNHKLFNIIDRPQWFSVKGGSKSYVEKLIANFKDKIVLNSKIKEIERMQDSVKIIFNDGSFKIFDEVVFACNADQALALLKNPSHQEIQILRKLNYTDNIALTHHDEQLMPKNKQAWASWVYTSLHNKNNNETTMSVNYWMNSLQHINPLQNVFVSLNPVIKPNIAKIFDENLFRHPQFNKEAIDAQQDIKSIQGQNNTWYCGAYVKYGFHEDGILSARLICEQMGLNIPW
jgi:predicted NAD/FAD-binding protein